MYATYDVESLVHIFLISYEVNKFLSNIIKKRNTVPDSLFKKQFFYDINKRIKKDKKL